MDSGNETMEETKEAGAVEPKGKDEEDTPDDEMRDPGVLQFMDKEKAAAYTQPTKARVPNSVVEASETALCKIFEEMGIGKSPLPPSEKAKATSEQGPSTHLPPEKQLKKKRHAYYNYLRAKERGCAVYGNEYDEVVFVTDLFDCKLDAVHEFVTGEYAGVVTHFFRLWQCGLTMTDRKTKNPRKAKLPAKATDAQKMLLGDNGQIIVEVNTPAFEVNKDIGDPFESTKYSGDIFNDPRRSSSLPTTSPGQE